MPTLNTLIVDFEAVYHAVEENGGELTPKLASTLDELNLAEKVKVDRVIFHLKALEGECDALKKLEDELAAKRKAKSRTRESLLNYVKWYMEQRQSEKLPGEVFRFQLVKSGKPPVEVLVPPEQLPREWTTISVVPNKEAIRRDLEQWGPTPPIGVSASLARLGEATISVRIY